MRSAVRAASAVAIFAVLALTGCSAESAPAANSGSPAPDGVTLPQGWTYVAGETVRPPATGTPALPVTVTDKTGAKVTVTNVDRIISAGDDVSSILGALGLGKNITAAPTDSVSDEGKAAPRKFEFTKNTGAEGLLAMNGTLFIGNNIARHSDVAAKFRGAGVPAMVIDDQLPLLDKIRTVADYVGLHDAGQSLATSVAGQIDQARQQAGQSTSGKGLRIIQVTASGAGGQKSVAAKGTAGAEMIAAAGAVSVGAEAGLRGFSREMSDEGVLASAPDVILLSVSDLAKWQGGEGLWQAFPTLKQTAAGTSGTVFVMPDQQMKFPGPDTGTGTLALVKALAGLKR